MTDSVNCDATIFTVLIVLSLVKFVTSCYSRSVSELLGQPCYKSDIPVKFVTSCQRVVPITWLTIWDKLYFYSLTYKNLRHVFMSIMFSCLSLEKHSEERGIQR